MRSNSESCCGAGRTMLLLMLEEAGETRPESEDSSADGSLKRPPSLAAAGVAMVVEVEVVPDGSMAGAVCWALDSGSRPR